MKLKKYMTTTLIGSILTLNCSTVQAPAPCPDCPGDAAVRRNYNECRDRLAATNEQLQRDYLFLSRVNGEMKRERIKAGLAGFGIGFGVGAVSIGIAAGILVIIRK